MRISFNALLLTKQAAGIGTLMRGILAGLQELRHSAKWFVYVRPGITQCCELPTWDGCRYIEIPWAATKSGRVMMELFGLPVWDRRYAIDLAYSPTCYLPLSQPLPAIATVVDFCWKRVPHAVPLARKVSLALRARGSLLRAAGIATISETMRRELMARYGNRLCVPVHPMPLGVDPRFFDGSECGSAAVRNRYGLLGGIMLASGGTDPRKDIRTLVRACAMSPDLLRDRQLVVVGPREQRAEERILGDLEPSVRKRIIFTGFVSFPDLMALFSAASLFVYPSLDEGFGLPVLEAMARGVPVVCSDLDVLREVGGDTISYSPPADPSSLARHVMWLLEDVATSQRLVKMARERAREFSWRASAGKLIALIEKVMEDKV